MPWIWATDLSISKDMDFFMEEKKIFKVGSHLLNLS